MESNFNECLGFVLAREGGWSDHPKDPGGATMKGVTLNTYSAWKKKPMTKDQLRKITDKELHDIYHSLYWLPAKCDQLPTGLDLLVFDMSVNSGPVAAIKNLQRTLGLVVDGKFGPATRKAAEIHGKYEDTLIEYAARRIIFWTSLKTWATFGLGWATRGIEGAVEAIRMGKK